MSISQPRTAQAPYLAIPDILPGLDGMRAFSILIVMLSHSALAHIVPGVFGVTVFFFVSGFLITSLLLAEQQRTGGIAVKSFYMRRFLRLYPPLIVSILATAAVYAAFGTPVNGWGMLGALAYLANYLAIFRPDLMQHLGGQLWSLAVEEHFYFVYPLLMLAVLPHRRRTFTVLIGLCIVSLGIRFFVEWFNPALASDYNGKATETRIDSILYGALGALIWWSKGPREWFLRYWKILIVLGFSLLILAFIWRNPVMRETVRYSLQGIGLIPLVLVATASGLMPRVTALLEWSAFKWIGRHSYSLYLWHMLAFEIGEHIVPVAQGQGWLTYGIGWVLAFGFAALSYRFVEAPFFALRKRFGSNVSRVDLVENQSVEGDAPVMPGAVAATPHPQRP